MALIDKETIRKKIERMKDEASIVFSVYDMGYENGKIETCNAILDVLDTLPEQPEEGLEEEVKKYWNEHALDYRIGRVADLDFMFLCARHFYELGQQSRPKVSDSSLEEEIDKYFQGWSNDDEYGDALMSDYTGVNVDKCKEIARHFAEWGRKQVLQEIYDGKVKPVDKITAAWLVDERNT